MSVIGHSPLAGASGAAGGADALYVDDVFSTYVYEGTGSTQSIDNGIDLAGEGGLVWLKKRSSTGNHWVFDTERGANSRLLTNTTGAANTGIEGLSFNSNGFTVNTDSSINASGEDHVMWSFRKAPGFFDVVTYSGTGSVQNISHSLGSVPGMIIIHCLDGSHDWEVYHRSTGATKSLHLNQYDAAATDSTVWNNTAPTSSVFTVGTSSNVNQNGHGYVAYLFAHDEQSFGTDSDEAIIKCGTYTGTGTSSNPEINLGFEPQWLMLKNTTNSSNWVIVDTMRGFRAFGVGGDAESLVANTNGAEPTNGGRAYMYSQGFTFSGETNSGYNSSGSTYIYMAIRRPHKPPTAGTEVFNPINDTGSGSSRKITAGNLVDLVINKSKASSSYSWQWVDRIRDAKSLDSDSTATETTGQVGSTKFDFMDGIHVSATAGWSNASPWGAPYAKYFFTRAAGFFDVVAYEGTSQNRTINHNLGATPELMIVKGRDFSDGWQIYNKVSGATKYNTFMQYGDATGSSRWNDTEPTSTVFTVGTDNGVNNSGYKYIAYLFATLDGISKISSYTGTGSNIDVDCGFTAGARFVLIKRIDGLYSINANWYVWDSVSGIVSGNDPYLLLNTTDAQVANTDYIDPLNAGFTVTSSAPAALNTSGGTYLFLAIA